ncbi:sensor histidine kinase [Pedobacter arcticus]|uniref:sensor histidine kinase n=1 Tax=Pedobacter arcticus TaxID=752140 RepID=UPI0003010073|nr:histidine kinase [Pedobacter arcticus]
MTASPLSNSKFKWVFLFLVAVFTAFQYYTLTLFHIDNRTAINDSIIANILLALCCWLISNSLSYYQPKGYKYLFVIVWCKVLAGIYVYALILIFDNIALYNGDNHFFLQLSLPVRFMFALLFIGSMATISILWYTQEENNEFARRKNESDKLTKEIELSSLREKLQPHFLFNSLNSISALTITQPKEARKMVHQLSDFLRGTLRKDDTLTALKTEFQHLELYLDIEKVRFGNRLNTQISADDTVLSKTLPPMLLQPLVENAIKFGLYDTLDEVTINISAISQHRYLQITITNPFDPQTSHTNKGTGFGLSSTQRRLQLIYNRTDLLTTEKRDGKFISILKIPQI